MKKELINFFFNLDPEVYLIVLMILGFTVLFFSINYDSDRLKQALKELEKEKSQVN